MNKRSPYTNRSRNTHRQFQRQMELRRQRLRSAVTLVVGIAVIAIITSISVSAVKNKNTKQTSAEAITSEPVATPKPTPQIPPVSEQNDLLKIAVEAQGTPDQKICYLTFDDGPTTAVTPSILETLRKYNVKATFFQLGSMIAENKELAKQVHDEGHLIANHSYSHDYDSLYATGDSFMAEIEKTNEQIAQVIGEEPFKLIRFPGGSYNAGSYASAKQTYKKLLQEKGYYYADWNCLNGDAEGGSRSAAQLVERVKQTATQRNIVVLMHDAAAKKTTAEALPTIIEYLKEQGYEFRRMDQIKYYDTGEDESTSSFIL